MADENEPQPGPSNPKKSRSEEYSTEQLLRILEGDSSDEEDFDSGADDFTDISESDHEGTNVHEDRPDDIFWLPESTGMQHFPFEKSERLLSQPSENSPIGFFRLLLTEMFLDKIVEETNSYATELFLSEKTTEHSRITTWKSLTIAELLVFLGVLLHTGLVQMRKLQDYWKKDPLFHISGIARSMSRNRFLIILRALHFSRNLDPKPADRLYKIRPVVQFFNDRMSEVYYPGRELSLDECMVLWRGRLTFRQYIKNKKNKYGIKLYMLTSSKGIILNFLVYSGMLGDFGGTGHTEKVVMHLLEGKLNNGHHVYMDNFYNSYNLAIQLAKEKTHCTGTLRIDRKNSPAQVKETKLKKGETIARYANGVMIGKWKDKRDVTYISTEWKNDMVEVENRRKQLSFKPLPIVEYNRFISGVDRQDQMISYYNSERKTLRWPVKLFVHFIEMCVSNSHMLYNRYSGNSKLPLYDFRLNFIKTLLPPPIASPSTRLTPSVQHVITVRQAVNRNNKIMRKKCRQCSLEGRRTDTIYECITCPERPGYCLECSTISHN